MYLKRVTFMAYLLLLLIGVGSESALASSDDTQQPIHIEADRAEIDEGHGVMTYTGHVKLRQGGIEVSADTVVVFATKEGDVQRITAQGQPVHYLQKAQQSQDAPDDEQKDVRGVSLRMEYDADSKQVLLLGKAEFWQGGNRFSGNRIQYDPKTERVLANAGSDDSEAGDKQRVTVTLQPKGKKANEQP
jgi:lipopolysaccharide export system protein LptA